MYITTDANILKVCWRVNRGVIDRMGTHDKLQAVLATQFQDFEKGEEFRDTLKDVLGEGVFNADGWFWGSRYWSRL